MKHFWQLGCCSRARSNYRCACVGWSNSHKALARARSLLLLTNNCLTTCQPPRLVVHYFPSFVVPPSSSMYTNTSSCCLLLLLLLLLFGVLEPFGLSSSISPSRWRDLCSSTCVFVRSVGRSVVVQVVKFVAFS